MVIRCKVNLKKSVFFSAFLCSVLFLFISISNTTYSLDLAANERCPDGYSEHNSDATYKCYKEVSMKSDLDEFLTFESVCVNEMDGNYSKVDSDDDTIGICLTNKTVITRPVKLDGNKGVFSLNGGNEDFITIPAEFFDGKGTAEIHYDFKHVREGYTFVGYSDEAGVDGMCNPKYEYGDTITNPGTVYYACWEKNDDTQYAYLTLDPNGGKLHSNNELIVSSNINGTVVPYKIWTDTFDYSYVSSVREGYSFAGWSTKLDGSNPIKSGKFNLNGDTTLYASWVSDGMYTVTLDPNGGALYTTDSVYKDIVGRTTSWSSGFLSFNYSVFSATKEGNTFMGWSTSPDGTNPVKNGELKLNSDVFLYATWQKSSSGGSSSGSPNITCSSNSIGLWCTDSNTSGGVSSLQTKLKYLGYYSGSIDGSAGPQTVEAIKSFQQKEGLTVDGNAGPATLEKLRLRYNEKITDTDDQETIPDDEEVETNPLSYYTVTFELDGGTFSNGDTNRKMVVSSEAILNPLPYNPTKAGYKFIGWYNSDNEKYEFYKNVSSNITLFAKWEKYSDDENCTYSCNSGDVFDPSTNKCIAVEKFSNNSTLISEVNYTKNCVNELLNYTDYSCSGNCNKENCSSAYTSNLWYENNNCKFGSSCTSSDNGSCSITMKKECYKLYEPKTDCDSNLPPETPDTNSPTFDLPIAIVWIVGGSALIFAIIYLRKYYNSQRV